VPFPAPAPAPGTTVIPPAPSQAPPAPAPINPESNPPAGIQQGSYYWQPAEGSGVRLEPPIPADQDSTRPRRRMPRVEEKTEGQGDTDSSSSLPVDIRQFAQAKENVSYGLRPSLEGLDWLKKNGYRAVLSVHAPDADETAAKKQVTQRGMKFLSLEVSPATLSQSVLDEFIKLVDNTKDQPLFVYDNDGMLAGGLWYLYFRKVEMESDDTARTKAGRLGLNVEDQGDHKEMWLAIQKLLSKKPGQE
jgi:hypothetical protein